MKYKEDWLVVLSALEKAQNELKNSVTLKDIAKRSPFTVNHVRSVIGSITTNAKSLISVDKNVDGDRYMRGSHK